MGQAVVPLSQLRLCGALSLHNLIHVVVLLELFHHPRLVIRHLQSRPYFRSSVDDLLDQGLQFFSIHIVGDLIDLEKVVGDMPSAEIFDDLLSDHLDEFGVQLRRGCWLNEKENLLGGIGVLFGRPLLSYNECVANRGFEGGRVEDGVHFCTAKSDSRGIEDTIAEHC